MPSNHDRIIPFQPVSDDPAEYWMWIDHVIAVLANYVPSGEDPQDIHWDHPDDQRKEEIEAHVLEKDHAARTDEALAKLFQTCEWPDRSASVAYYAQKRLTFGRQQAKLFATKSRAAGRSLVATASGVSHREILFWLTTDVYREKFGLNRC
jgi:hypothetical protein